MWVLVYQFYLNDPAPLKKRNNTTATLKTVELSRVVHLFVAYRAKDKEGSLSIVLNNTADNREI